MPEVTRRSGSLPSDDTLRRSETSGGRQAGSLPTPGGQRQVNITSPDDSAQAPLDIRRSGPGAASTEPRQARLVAPEPGPPPSHAGEPAAAQQHQAAQRAGAQARQLDPSGATVRWGGVPDTPVAARMATKAEFFRSHGIREPRSDIRIPVLNVTLMRRDTAYKNVIARLDAYHHELKNAGNVTSQDRHTRAATYHRLNRRLSELDQANRAALTGLSDTRKNVAVRRFMTDLNDRVSLQESLHESLFNSPGEGWGDIVPPISWQDALEFKRHGLNIGSNVKLGERQALGVVSSRPFGRGNYNTVQHLRFDNGAEGIFKQGTAMEPAGASRPAVVAYSKIPSAHPRYAARNVASSNLDRQLGGETLVNSEFYSHDGRFGVLMERAKGMTVNHLTVRGSDMALGQMLSNPDVIKDFNNLQVLDAITGQHDRHNGNVVVETDAQGRYVKLKGIDHDCSFGSSRSYNKLNKFSDAVYNPYHGVNFMNIAERAAIQCSYNVGLPPLIDARQADKILAPGFIDEAKQNVKGLLNQAETDRMTERIEQLQQHVRKLKDSGRTITDWNSGILDGGERVMDVLVEAPFHSYFLRFMGQVKQNKPARDFLAANTQWRRQQVPPG
ncbi:MAG: hypothetical protein OXI88_01130 [Gammaproteobacteria bacterium]|nr:hypothetical protein [Gammaproteobacteria bacterium]MDE0284160.1 hypothetical protein [Gammaproteobacteria bacterium]MDE0510379.1 hypothetical protein [Gammaproteobacteria bacterium]